MAYLNKIDINGRTYYLQHLTDGKYEATLPVMTKDSKIVIQDTNSSSVGDTNTPVYIKDNKVVAFSEKIGNAYTPVYVDYGNIKPLSGNIGSTTNPIYMNEGAITASNETVGSGIMPIYMQDGVITPSDSTVGSSVKPMYLNGGTITESDANVGSDVIPTYMNNGEITASTATVGSNVKPIYLNAGEVTVSDGNVGAMNQPIYMNNGEIIACSDNVGSDGIPVYMLNGVITACGTIPITSGGTGAITKEKALENFGLTATAAELNTLDGIAATVTELNYVKGVTSNIQGQLDNKVDKVDGKGLSSNDYSDDEKSKLAGIADGANKYTHPTRDVIASGFYKIAFDALGHVSSVEAVTKEDITNLGVPAQDTTYGVAVATTETENGVDGLLSATDKAKYDKYEATIAELQKQIEELQKLVEGYHPVTEPEPEPDETE